MLVEIGNSFNPFQEIPNREILIWRMDGIWLQTKSHKNWFSTQDFLKSGNNRNTAATSYRNRLLAKCLTISFIRSLVCSYCCRRDIGRTTMQVFYLNFNVCRSDGFKMRLNKCCNFIMVLIGLDNYFCGCLLSVLLWVLWICFLLVLLIEGQFLNER